MYYQETNNLQFNNNIPSDNNLPSDNHVLNDLQDYMLTSKNLSRFLKYQTPKPDKQLSQKKQKPIIEYKKREIEIYKPIQKDSLFWCFYILKHGYSNYEMEINNQYFTIEKQEKIKYIGMLRKNKDILKIYKIKPLTEIEDDLANNERISIKTFFCIMCY